MLTLFTFMLLSCVLTRIPLLFACCYLIYYVVGCLISLSLLLVQRHLYARMLLVKLPSVNTFFFS